MTRLVAALPLLAAACSGDSRPTVVPPEPPPVAEAPTPDAAPAPDAVPTPGWLVIDAGDPQPPAWYRPGGDGAPLTKVGVVAVGDRSAVLTARLAGKLVQVGVDLDRGVLGWLQLPVDLRDETFVGIGGAGDQLFVYPQGGPLLRADSVEAALKPDAFAPVAGAPTATYWAFAPGYVLAGSGRDIWVSRNGGRFRRTRIGKDESVVGVEIGSGGQMLVRVELATAVYEDRVSIGGRRWRKASWQNGMLSREGGWLYADDCAERVAMARGTTRFVRVNDLPQPADYLATAEMAGTGRDLVTRPSVAYATAARPKPPVFDRSREARGRRGPCGGRVGHGYGTGRIGPKGLLGYLRLSHGPTPRHSPRHLALFHDGACADGDAVVGSDGLPTGRCNDGAAVTRAPHLLAGDGSRYQVVDPPAGCIPRGAHSAGGLRVVLCRDGAGTRFYVRDGDRWVDEGSVAAGDDEMASRVGQAADGTVGFAPSCAQSVPCAIAVRSPAPLGQGRWRLVRRDRAYGYRVLTGGRALAIVLDSDDDENRAEISLVEVGLESERTLVSGIELTSRVSRFDLAPDGVYFTLRDAATGRNARYRVRTDGALVPIAGPVR